MNTILQKMVDNINVQNGLAMALCTFILMYVDTMDLCLLNVIEPIFLMWLIVKLIQDWVPAIANWWLINLKPK